MEIENLRYSQALYGFWENTLSPGSISGFNEKWNEQVCGLSYYGRGMEEALQFLYTRRPTFDAFIDWVQLALKPEQAEVQEGNILTEEDLRFWDENGFIVIKNAVPEEQCVAAGTAIFEFLGANPSNPESWYQDHDGKNGLMLNFFQHPALNANRNSAKIRKIYQELYGDTDIYLLIDKVSFNPPETDKYVFRGSGLHWDVSLHPPIPYELQGLLYLNDVTAAEGAFHCVPGFHKKVNTWLAELPAGINPRDIAPAALKAVPVPGNAGDLVIWQQALPHCATPNRGTSPRLVQYIAYKPVNAVKADIWK